MNYRADIDGLRAIAVLCVVIFHLGVAGFQGGYVGVDVFFVISGFLITAIIKQGHENQSFRFADFYTRRIRRLLPPLIATVAVTLLGASFILTPEDMTPFARSATAALFSVSNFVFYAESGYWDAASELKPLLHTWSLGVEEQFYLFWPALIVGLLSLRKRIPFGASLTLITFAGAALCIGYSTVDPSAAFYLLPFRVFQFSLGALVIPLSSALTHTVFARSAWLPSASFWLGLSCIGASVFFFHEATLFPGWAVLLPTTGTALMLLAGTTRTGLPRTPRALMENPLSIWLGRVSYSMYLVHWPLIVLYRYYHGVDLHISDQLTLAATILVATCALHYGIERRFYRRSKNSDEGVSAVSDNQFALRTVGVSVFLAVITANAWLSKGWTWRFPTIYLSTEQIEAGKQIRFDKAGKACRLANLTTASCNMAADFQILVLGNSSEVDGYNFMSAAYGEDPNVNLILFGNTNRCTSMRGVSARFVTDNANCQNALATLFEPAFLERLDIIVYAVNQPYAANKTLFLEMLQTLKKARPAIKIVTFGGYINTVRHCSHYINKTGTTDSCAAPENVSYFADKFLEKPLHKAFYALESYYIDRVALLCRNRVLETCLTRANDDTPALYDRVHYSMPFSEMSGRLFAMQHPDLLTELIDRPTPED